MINLRRNAEPPMDLQRPEIAQYLQDLSAYKTSIELHESGELETVPFPPAKPGSYRTSDLLDAFEDQFFSKCYLTEQQFRDGAELEVDHFIPRSENETLLYDWQNLFPISPLANRMRPKKTPEGGYLNPCTDDVESEIRHLFVPLLDIFSFEARNPSNSAARNTASLLQHLHNGSAKTQRSVRGLQKAIKDRYVEIGELYVIYCNPVNEDEYWQAAAKLRKFFSRESAFTMLMRNSPIGQRLREFHQD